MEHDGDDLRDQTHMADADMKLGLTGREGKELQEEPDTTGSSAGSHATSAVLPRESAYGPPPPVPAKDSIYIKRKIENTREGGSSPAAGQGEADVKSEQGGKGDSADSDLTRWNSATSAAITIGISASTLNVSPAKTTSQMPTPQGLGVVSPPESPRPVLKQLSIPAPTRPARPSSLRLSSLTRDGPLTTDKVVVVDPSRPSTARSQHSLLKTACTTTYSTSTMGKGNRIKYGRGKYATTELIPQPSDHPEDPLNWSMFKKEVNLYALLMTAAICNVMKTALISVNEDLAHQYSVSYTAVAALTGVPLLLSAVSGLASSTAARLWGRRPVLLASMTLIFIGLVWNTRVTTSYGQFMAARVFQGLGWGAFDTLVVGSIIDTFFEHERTSKLATYRIISVATLWGPPLIGGVASQNRAGFSLQFEVLAVFQIISIPLLVLGAPETMFDRTSSMMNMATAGWSPGATSKFPHCSKNRFSKDVVIKYIETVARPFSYRGPSEGVVMMDALLQAPRAMAAPTTVLAFMASFLPHALLWGFLASVSGLFARAPSSLVPATVGSLVTFPFLFSTTAVAGFTLWPSWSETLTALDARTTHIYALGAGSALSFIGILGFGLYVADNDAATLRFSVVGFLLGLVAAGAYILEAPAIPLVRRSAQFTSPNLAISLRSTIDMDAGVTVWRALSAGVFAMAIPSAIVAPASAAGLRGTGIGVAVVQLLVASALGAVWWMWEEDIRRLDGRAMDCKVDLTFLNSRASYQESYFETDD